LFVATATVFIELAWILYQHVGMRMPYLASFFTRTGLGPDDLVLNRAALLDETGLQGLTVACGIGFLVCCLAWWGARRSNAQSGPDGAAMLVWITAGQTVGLWIPSYYFAGWRVDDVVSPSLDRYMLPLLPLAICLSLWALKNVRLALLPAWLVMVALGLFAVIATRDALVLQQATWELARSANARGIPNEQLDAGAAWDGYHVWDPGARVPGEAKSPHYAVPSEDPSAVRMETPPWWIRAWVPGIDSTYVITAEPVVGFAVIDRLEYSAWLARKPAILYLLRRPPAVLAPDSVRSQGDDR
jgi:hypothetical protein